MNKRLKELREFELKLNKEDFGKKIGVSGSMIGMIESGKRNISKLVFNNICREFDVNEEWLREGKTPIFREMTEVEKMKKQIDQAMEGRNEFVKQSLYILASLDDAEWEILEKMAFKIIDYNRNKRLFNQINKKDVTKL